MLEITQENLFEIATSATIPASINTDQNQVEAKKSAIQIEQEDTEKIYEPLINALQGETGMHILNSIDFKAFQEQVLKIILIVLKRQERLLTDDKVIVDQALSLWISVIIYNSDLLQFIYDNQWHAKNAGEESLLNKLLEFGLFCANYGIRDCFRDNLKVLF